MTEGCVLGGTYDGQEYASVEPLFGELLPGDRAPEGHDLPWTVYAIHADHEPNDPFYIGITTNIEQRAAAHNQLGSSAYDYSRALEARGIECSLTTIAQFATEAEARTYESIMIALHPRLTNRNVEACTRMLMALHAPAEVEDNLQGAAHG